MRVLNKLVRDRIPEIIAGNGQTCKTHTLSPDEHLAALKDKLREEVAEYEESGALEELADILEVVRALAEAGGHSVEELERVRIAKAEARGGFRKRIFLESVE